ncbi:hypothetical protein ACGFZP_21405 [Kitasatospora sp. NPDC048239]|uniref:hypothetical protein n=1 Tax=Kitasatospora sp. NPDC048239 TaxID=3364046 RepID=UPI00372444AC
MAQWLGQPGGLLLLPCGVHWDAVRMPEAVGLAVLEVLLTGGQGAGPFLHDRDSRLVYALVAPAGGIGWSRPGVRLLSTGAYLAAPSPEMDWLNGRVGWVHMPVDPEPTDPAHLAAVLTAVATDTARHTA